MPTSEEIYNNDELREKDLKVSNIMFDLGKQFETYGKPIKYPFENAERDIRNLFFGNTSKKNRLLSGIMSRLCRESKTYGKPMKYPFSQVEQDIKKLFFVDILKNTEKP